MHNRPTTPINVTLLGIFVLFITCWNTLRVFGVISNWQVLSEFGANPTYILGTGTIWMLCGLWLLVFFWRRSIYFTRATIFSSIIYYVWYWFDRLFVQVSPAPNVLFSAVFSTALLILLIIITTLPGTRAFFYKEKL